MDCIKMTMKEIEEFLENSNPSLALPSFKVLLRIRKDRSYFKAMSGVMQKSLMDLNRKSPLFMSSVLAIKSDGTYTFDENFEAYIKGIVDWKYVVLKPTSIVNIGGTLINMARSFSFYNGELSNCTLTGPTLVEYLTRHPYIFKKSEVEDEFTEDSAVYGVAINSDYISDNFLNIIQYHLINYILELKTQVNYTEIPIEIYSGLLDKKSELDNILNEFFLSSTTYSHLWR